MRFLGSSARYEVRLTNGDVLAVRIPLNVARRSLKLGDLVSIMVDPSEIVVYDYPTLGLQRELVAY